MALSVPSRNAGRFTSRVGGGSAFYVRLIMRSAIIFVIAALLTGCARTPDAIDGLVADLSSTHGMWINGYSLDIRLPNTASTEQVVEQVFKQAIFDTGRATPPVSGKVTSYKILKTRRVYIPNDSQSDTYTAVLVETNFGQKIILLKPGSTWWCRYYDANRIYYAKPSA